MTNLPTNMKVCRPHLCCYGVIVKYLHSGDLEDAKRALRSVESFRALSREITFIQPSDSDLIYSPGYVAAKWAE